jgi:hypothetical protein
VQAAAAPPAPAAGQAVAAAAAATQHARMAPHWLAPHQLAARCGQTLHARSLMRAAACATAAASGCSSAACMHGTRAERVPRQLGCTTTATIGDATRTHAIRHATCMCCGSARSPVCHVGWLLQLAGRLQQHRRCRQPGPHCIVSTCERAMHTRTRTHTQTHNALLSRKRQAPRAAHAGARAGGGAAHTTGAHAPQRVCVACSAVTKPAAVHQTHRARPPTGAPPPSAAPPTPPCPGAQRAQGGGMSKHWWHGWARQPPTHTHTHTHTHTQPHHSTPCASAPPANASLTCARAVALRRGRCVCLVAVSSVCVSSPWFQRRPQRP